MAHPGTGGPVDPMAELGGLWGGSARRPPVPTAAPAATPPPPDKSVLRGAPAPGEPGAAEPAPPLRQLVFHGTGGSLFGIWLVNVLRTLGTVGVYHFWAKTRIRAYFASQSELEGDRFAYHGTGGELLVGALKAAAFFAVPFALFNIPPWFDLGVVAQTGAVVLAYVAILLLIPLAIVGTRRYRSSRTSWRGIRFSFRGAAREFMNLYLKGALLSVLTLGLYYPFFHARRHQYLTSRSYFGNERFDWDGRGGDLFGIYALAVLLALPTLGLYAFWFQARKQRYIWGHTTFSSARFRSTVTGGAVFGLKLVNFILLVVTLGLASPWVSVRNTRFAFRYLSLDGPLDVERIAQEAQAASATGEGLAGFLDTGFEFEW